MHVICCVYDLSENSERQFFIEEAKMLVIAYGFISELLDELKQVFALAELHDEMHMAFGIYYFKELNDVWMIHASQYINFSVNGHELRLASQQLLLV